MILCNATWRSDVRNIDTKRIRDLNWSLVVEWEASHAGHKGISWVPGKFWIFRYVTLTSHNPYNTHPTLTLTPTLSLTLTLTLTIGEVTEGMTNPNPNNNLNTRSISIDTNKIETDFKYLQVNEWKVSRKKGRLSRYPR